ncbi:MAG TPA: response regulator [Stellaceae bacterium]|nr:response regulator [Stellaceae bacterium]
MGLEEHSRLAALEAGEIGTWEWDLAGGRMRWSTQMFRNMGVEYRAELDLYPALLGVAHAEDRARVAAGFDHFRTRPGAMRLEFRIVWPDGRVRWLVFLGRVEADADGRPTRMLGITIDSSARRFREQAAEAAVRDSERRLRELNERLEQLAEQRARQLDASRAQIQAIFDNSPDWQTLFRAAKDGRFLYEDLNHATERAYGLGRGEVIGRAVEDILGPEQSALPLSYMRACVATGENQRYTARRILAGVARSIDVMFVRVPEKSDGDWLIMSTARDITEREAIEQQLRQAQKMEAVGHLTGGIAHDFNNLLTAIIGNLELLHTRAGADPAAARHVQAAQRAAENGARLTEQLLAFSRRQHLQPRAVNLNAVISEMGDMLARTIGSTVKVRSELEPDIWPALVDPTQIEIAILNLAINARDAMPLGGTLTIETRNLDGADGALPRELDGRDCVCVSVRDTGTGMSEEVLRSAVEPFFTTKDPGKGSGLGLSQVYGMVRQSDGALRIESRPDDGTAVHLYLPRAAAAEAAVQQSRERSAARARGARILVVDDDPGVREITVQMLREAGYGVADVVGGPAALAALERGEVYDLIVVDVAMPGMSGVETVRRARERWPAQRALYITGYADIGGADLVTAGEPVVKKPFRFSELQEAVRGALRRPADTAKVIRLRRG